MGDAIGRAARQIPEFFLVNECLRQHTSSGTPLRRVARKERRCGHAVYGGLADRRMVPFTVGGTVAGARECPIDLRPRLSSHDPAREP